MNSDHTTVVLDAGARYGMHPTWKAFQGDLRYVMFEPDRDEAARLARKYSGRPAVEVVAKALSDQPGTLTIHSLRHKGQSSVYRPDPTSVWFSGSRQDEGDVVGSYEVEALTVDAHCAEHGLRLDFMKVDTEGSDLAIVKGATAQLEQSVLGLRTEVLFSGPFIGAPDFSDMFSFLTRRGFVLLNMDYDGRGTACGPFAPRDRYGMLTSTDATWVRQPATLLEPAPDATLRLAKYASFCLRNHAPDLAMRVLLDGRAQGQDLAALAGTALHKALRIEVQKLFYQLERDPAQRRDQLQETFHALFGQPMPVMHEFFESDDLNPT